MVCSTFDSEIHNLKALKHIDIKEEKPYSPSSLRSLKALCFYYWPYLPSIYSFLTTILLNTYCMDKDFDALLCWWSLIMDNRILVICPPSPVSFEYWLSWHPDMQNTFLFFHSSYLDKSKIDPEWQASTQNRQGMLSGKFFDMTWEV